MDSITAADSDFVRAKTWGKRWDITTEQVNDLAEFLAELRHACADVAEGEILINVEDVPPGTTKREYGAVLGRNIARDIRAGNF